MSTKQTGNIAAVILVAMMTTPALPARAEGPTISIGTTRTLTERTLACPRESDIVRLSELAEDTMAYTRFVGEHGCAMILPGTVVIEDSSWWHSTVCLRPYGEPACAWTHESFQKDNMK